MRTGSQRASGTNPLIIPLSIPLPCLNPSHPRQLKEYIAVLPAAIDTPYFWTAEERAELQCEALHAAIETQQGAWGAQYDGLMRSSPQCGVSRADFDWALACVVSRTFSGPFVGSSIQVRVKG